MNHTPTLFRDVSSLLGHVHRDEPFDDFERQPLLPRKLSQLGPGVAWFDLDGDRRDDLLVATGKGGRTAVRRNRGRDRFVASELPALKPATSRDQTTILGWQRSLQERALLIGLSHHEDGQPTGAAVITCDAGVDGCCRAACLGSSSGPLALADIDGDGPLRPLRGRPVDSRPVP